MRARANFTTDSADMGTAALAGRSTLAIGAVRALSRRSDARGLLRFAVHLTVMAGTGWLVWRALPHGYLLVPALVLHGFTIVAMFAPMHECVHRTAFAMPLLNELFGWLAGLLGFYNFHFYRHFHTWHHRYTQDPQRDPELMPPKAKRVGEYLVEISGYKFWTPRPRLFWKLATGRLEAFPYVPADGRDKVKWSARAQTAVYLAGALSIGLGYPSVLWFWFLPAVLAQPLLRLLLIAEHTGCSHDENGLTNTRTTLTWFPVRLLMWNMPFHAEHHLYPSIPFHRLPDAHRELKRKLAHVAPSYVDANRTIVRGLRAPSTENRVLENQPQ